jgi:hypothetical protein
MVLIGLIVIAVVMIVVLPRIRRKLWAGREPGTRTP